MATRAKRHVSLAYCAAQKRVVVVAAARRNSLRTVQFDREAGFGNILVAVRRLTRLVGNGNRVWNGLSNTDRDRDRPMRHSCEGSSAVGQVCNSP
jgi:hypothetical protein